MIAPRLGLEGALSALPAGSAEPPQARQGKQTNGAAGVEQVARTLRTELEAAMALCDTPTLAQIDRGVLWLER
jgi:hypothetical protein